MSGCASRSGPRNNNEYKSNSENARLELSLKNVELKAKVQVQLLETEMIVRETVRICNRIQEVDNGIFASMGYAPEGEDTSRPFTARDTILTAGSQQSVCPVFRRTPLGSIASSTTRTTTTTTTSIVIQDENIIDLYANSEEEEDEEDESHRQSQQQQDLPLLTIMSHCSLCHTDNVQRIGSSSALSSGLGSQATSLVSPSDTRRMELPPAYFSSPSFPAASSEE